VIPQLSTAKLIGFGLGIIAVLGFIWLALSWKNERDALRDWQTVVVSATADASGNPKLRAADVPKQIRELGSSLETVKSSLARQNAAVTALEARTEQQQREASQASQDARTRAKGPERVSDSLSASSRSTERLAKPCEPSKALMEAWK